MSGQRGRRPVLDSAGTVIAFVANATNSVLRSKMLLLGALAALFAVAAIPILSRADMPTVAANSTLKCYDSAGTPILCRADMLSVAANNTLKCYDSVGNHEPCVARPSASSSRMARTYQPATLATTVPNEQASQATTAPYQQASAATTPPYQQASWATTAVVLPANWTSSTPAPKHISTPGKRRGLSVCGRHLIPCFFSALRRGVTHMASVAAIAAGARPVREHL
jgi:hypothetical protein